MERSVAKRSELAEVEAAVGTRKEELRDVEGKARAADENLERTRGRIRDTRAELTKENERLNTVRSETAGIEALRADREGLEAEVSQLQVHVDSLKQEIRAEAVGGRGHRCPV